MKAQALGRWRAPLSEAVALVAVLGAAAGLSAWLTADLWGNPTGRLPHTTFTDGHLVAVSVGVAELRAGGLWDLHTTLLGWPEGLGFRPLMWPVIAAAAALGPVLGINLTWLGIPVFNALGGYALGRALGAGRWGAVMGGTLTAWTPWVRETLGNGQFEQAPIGLIGFIWGTALLCARRPKLGAPLLGLCVLGGGLSAPNCAMAGLLGLPILALGAMVVDGLQATPGVGTVRARVGARLRAAGLQGWVWAGLASGVAAGLVYAYLSANFGGGPSVFEPRQGSDGSIRSVATLASLFSPPGTDVYQRRVIHCTFLGWTWLTAGALGLVLGRLRALPIGLVAVVIGVLSLGPTTAIGDAVVALPMAWVEWIAPITAKSGSAYRLVAGVAVALAGTAAVGVGRVGAWRSWAPVPIVVVAGVYGFLETRAFPGHHPPTRTRDAWRAPEVAALSRSGGAVLDLPLLNAERCEQDVFDYLNNQVVHGRPVLHDMMPPIDYLGHDALVDGLTEAWSAGDCADRVGALLAEAGIGVVVLHTESKCLDGPGVQACLVAAFGAPGGARDLRWWGVRRD